MSWRLLVTDNKAWSVPCWVRPEALIRRLARGSCAGGDQHLDAKFRAEVEGLNNRLLVHSHLLSNFRPSSCKFFTPSILKAVCWAFEASSSIHIQYTEYSRVSPRNKPLPSSVGKGLFLLGWDRNGQVSGQGGDILTLPLPLAREYGCVLL